MASAEIKNAAGVVRMALAMVMLFACTVLKAQDEGYFLEIGPMAGTSFYLGDANKSLFRDTHGSFGVMLRYNPNPHFSVKSNLSYAHISGCTDNLERGVTPVRMEFDRKLVDFGVQAEISVLGYGLTKFNNCHRISPYFLLGLGLTYAAKPLDSDFALNIPVGLGVRFKVARRVNLGLEWTFRFTTSDKLDVSKDYTAYTLESPFLIKGKGLQNKDCYSVLSAFVSFDVLGKPCNCNTEEIKKKRK